MKDKPTPKRREIQKRRKNPLIISNLDKKTQKVEEKRRLEEMKYNRRKALETGDEKYLPLKDQGIARRLTRNFIDSHTYISEFFMPVALLIIILFYVLTAAFKNYKLAAAVVLFIYLFIVIIIIDSIIKGFHLKQHLLKVKKLRKEQIPKGTIWYGISRALQFRKFRLPKPQVKRGDFDS